MIPVNNELCKKVFFEWLDKHLENYLDVDLIGNLCIDGKNTLIMVRRDDLCFINEDKDVFDKSKQKHFANYEESKKIDEFLSKIGIYDIFLKHDLPNKKIMTFTEYLENYLESDD